jgi:hypothetical protein
MSSKDVPDLDTINKDETDQDRINSNQIAIDLNTDNDNHHRNFYDPSSSIFINFGEVVCVGATAIIIILLLCILLFFEFRDHNTENYIYITDMTDSTD